MVEPNQTRLDEFDNMNEHHEIFYRGCLDAEKSLTKKRMTAMNANRFRCQHEEKINGMIEFYNNNKIDAVMLSKTNGK